MRFIILILLFFFVGLNVQAQKAVSFKIKNFGFEVEGSFGDPKGEIRFDAQNPNQALFNVSIDAASINTNIELRDKHLRKLEYFDVKNFPVIKFISSKIEPDAKTNYWIAKGNLTLKKTTKEIAIMFTQKEDYLDGSFTINRRDFEIGGKSLSLADELTVYLHVRRPNL